MRACEDCAGAFEPPRAQQGWRKVRCPACSAGRAATRAWIAQALELGDTLALSPRQGKRLAGYLRAAGARYARWERLWVFPSRGVLERFQRAAIAGERLRPQAERHLQAAGFASASPAGTGFPSRETARMESASRGVA